MDLISSLESMLKEEGYYVWDVKYFDKGDNAKLDVLIDGVTLYECSELSRKISSFIDENDLIRHSYLLTVSSPGINRKLTKLDHYHRSIGKNAKIKTEKESYKGIIQGVEGETVIINSDGNIIKLDFSAIKKTNLNII